MAILLDLSHTSHTRARTGIQRVTRALSRELGEQARALTYDPYLREWRELERWEQDNLAASDPGESRGASWPWTARWRGRWRRAIALPGEFDLKGDFEGFLTAEIFSPAIAARLPHVFPRVAVFHDAIALRFPEITPSGTVARFPGYLQELLRFDGIAAVSDDSRGSLLDYWRWLGVAHVPPVKTISLGVDPFPVVAPASAPAASAVPEVLSVGTLEGRKNHLALVEACELLWARGEKFSLRMVGSVQRQTGQAALARIQALQAAGRPLRYEGPLGDAGLEEAYAACAFTVYPSLAEGFGLPVVESLARGRPCICSSQGALGELARGGGCLSPASLDAAGLAEAIAQLLAKPAEVAALAAFLCSDEAAFITGSAYDLDGGFTLLR